MGAACRYETCHHNCAGEECPNLAKESMSIAIVGKVWENDLIANYDLLRASADGDLQGILSSVNAGADINSHGGGGWMRPSPVHLPGGTLVHEVPVGMTPLMRAAGGGHAAAVRLLVRLRASVVARDEDGMQPLHFAATANCYAACAALLEAGAERSALDDEARDAYACLDPKSLRYPRPGEDWGALLLRGSERAPADGAGVG
mmetsp:Transcript_52435/g.147145  ORF Transcript_52435/g.147145 Transcript_52435/m.147145 type:complete len:203 (+) Transcript_52435:111-719(+)